MPIRAVAGLAGGAVKLAGGAIGAAGKIAGPLAMAGGGILQGFMGSRNKKNEAAVAKYNAAVAREDKKAIEYQTKFLQERQAEAGARVKGDLEAGIGGSGIVSTQGAPMLALALQDSELQLENYLIGFQGRIEADMAESMAKQYDMQKKMARIGARQALIGGFLGAGAAAGSALAALPKKKPTGTNTGFATGYTSTATPGAGRL